jgi:hypothetical protein
VTSGIQDVLRFCLHELDCAPQDMYLWSCDFWKAVDPGQIKISRL